MLYPSALDVASGRTPARLRGRAPSAATWPTAARATATVVVFALCFLGACRLVRAGIEAAAGPGPLDEGLVGLKFRAFERHKDDYDTVFIGTSRVYRELSPTIFDGVMERAGDPDHPGRSFNFGIPGMSQAEILHTLRWVLEQEPARLRLVILEGKNSAFINEANLFTQQIVSWHRPDIALRLIGAELTSTRPLPERIDKALVHLQHLGLRTANVGNAVPALRRYFALRARPAAERAPYRGYLPLDKDPTVGPFDSRRQKFLQNVARLPRMLERYGEELPETDEDVDDERADASPSLVAFYRWTLTSMVAEAAAAGVTPVFVCLPPRWEPPDQLVRARDDGLVPTLFRYDDPRAEPGFYRQANLFNFGHLNSKGAAELTVRVARDVAALAPAR